MKTILVTGSDGLIGWHFRCFLSTLDDVEIIPCSRQQFGNDDYVVDAINRSDAIAHFAGMNRGEEEDVFHANIQIAERLIACCNNADKQPHIVYSSSTHIDGPSRYGESKRLAGEALRQAAEKNSGTCTNMVLPHVFGEHGKPFYNSVVSTFCYQIANGEQLTVNADGELSPLHAGDVAREVWKAIESKHHGELRPAGRPTKVIELKDILEHLAARYAEGTVPNLDDRFQLQLFNTYRSYIPHEKRPVDLTLHSDQRGWLFEAIRSEGQGQTFLSTTKPEITRGNHFHLHKVERFLVVQGQAKIRLRKLFSDDVHTFNVSGERPQAIDIPTLHTHNISNVGTDPLLTLFWSAELFDPENPDTYFLEV